MVLDNPAARLLSVLQELNSLPPNTPIPSAIATVLSSNINAKTDLVRRVGLVISLPDQIVIEVKAIEEVISREILLRWHEPVSNALNNILFINGPINQVTSRYGEGDLIALQMCSDLLHRHRREALLTEAELKRITDLLNELHSVIQSQANIDSQLRDLLLAHIRVMEQAIDDIPFRGTAGLHQAAAQTYGMLALRPDLTAKEKDNTIIWQKLTAVISAITAALSFGTATVQALEASPSAQPTSVVIVENLPMSITAGAQLAVNGSEP